MLLFWILLTVVVCFFLYLYMIMPNTSRRSKILPYLKRDYAHRGLHDSSRLIPENSMPAFREAVKQNLAIELDIHLTRDGKVVVFHDESLKRICNAEGTVEGSTFDALQHLHLSGPSEHMPLFSDVLRYVNGRVPLLIELKLPDSNMKLCPAAWDILKDYKMYLPEYFPLVKDLIWSSLSTPLESNGFTSMRLRFFVDSFLLP